MSDIREHIIGTANVLIGRLAESPNGEVTHCIVVAVRRRPDGTEAVDWACDFSDDALRSRILAVTANAVTSWTRKDTAARRPRYPRPDPGHNLWLVDPESCCPGCSGQRWENVGTCFTNRWLCLDCGWSTSTNEERPLACP